MSSEQNALWTDRKYYEGSFTLSSDLVNFGPQTANTKCMHGVSH